MTGFMRVYTGYGKLLHWLAVVAGVATFAMMWLVDVNVIGRKLFNAPLLGSVEISQSLLVFSIMLGLPHAQAVGAHLRVTLVVGRVPRRLGEVLFGLAMLAGAALFTLMAYSTYGFAMRAYDVGEEVWGAAFRFHLWPVKAALPIGAALLALQFLLDAIRVLVFRAVEYKDDIASSPHREGK